MQEIKENILAHSDVGATKEGLTTTDEIMERIATLKARAEALKPMMNRHQRRAAESMARKEAKQRRKKRMSQPVEAEKVTIGEETGEVRNEEVTIGEDNV